MDAKITQGPDGLYAVTVGRFSSLDAAVAAVRGIGGGAVTFGLELSSPAIGAQRAAGDGDVRCGPDATKATAPETATAPEMDRALKEQEHRKARAAAEAQERERLKAEVPRSFVHADGTLLILAL